MMKLKEISRRRIDGVQEVVLLPPKCPARCFDNVGSGQLGLPLIRNGSVEKQLAGG